MILVTGSTGNVGRELVAQLAARGEPVQAVTRRPAAARFPAGVEVVYGDLEDPASIEAAFSGADHAVLMSAQPPGSAEHPTHDLRLVEAAERAGVGRAVKLSVSTAALATTPSARGTGRRRRPSWAAASTGRCCVRAGSCPTRCGGRR